MSDQRQPRTRQRGPQPPPDPPPNVAVALLREIRDGMRTIRAILLFWFWAGLVGVLITLVSLDNSL